MKMNRRILLFTLCALTLSGGVVAQKQDTQQQPQPPMKQASAAPIAGVIPLGVTVTEAGLLTSGYRATKLMNSDVYNDAGQKIGKIGDLVISPNGEVSVAVIDVGGFIRPCQHGAAVSRKELTQIHPHGV